MLDHEVREPGSVDQDDALAYLLDVVQCVRTEAGRRDENSLGGTFSLKTASEFLEVRAADRRLPAGLPEGRLDDSRRSERSFRLK